jgi:glutamine cyclotransferase
VKNQLIVKAENRPVLKCVQRVLGLLFILFLGRITTAQDVRYGYNVVEVYPHEIGSFTQGLVYHEGYLFEGSGKNGQSMLRKVNLADGEVLMSKRLSDRYFGEGVEIVGEKIYQLTWQSHMVFVYDKNNFEQLGTHYNPTQGWGLAYDGEHLILSDGTDSLQFLDPGSFTAVRKVQVKFNDQPINNLNELEYIDGEVWANIWQTDFIVRIDPESGEVNSIIDLTGLSERTQLGSSEAVLNGIAWDSQNRRLFVTGKHWANLFEIELVEN